MGHLWAGDDVRQGTVPDRRVPGRRRGGVPAPPPAAWLVPRLLPDQPLIELTSFVATVSVAVGSGTEPYAER
jgi:hypothetical protein